MTEPLTFEITHNKVQYSVSGIYFDEPDTNTCPGSLKFETEYIYPDYSSSDEEAVLKAIDEFAKDLFDEITEQRRQSSRGRYVADWD